MSECTNVERLFPLSIYGELSAAEQDHLRQHLLTCETCAARYEALQQTLELVDRAPDYRPSDALLARARARLKVRLHREDRRRSISDWLENLAWWLRDLPPVVPRFATAVAFLTAGVFLGRFVWTGPEVPAVGPPSGLEAGVQLSPGKGVEIASIGYDAATGMVEIRYTPRVPVTVRGRPEEAPIRQILTAAMRQSDPSLRLRAVRALSLEPKSNEEVVEALVAALKSDTTLGVRLRVVKVFKEMPLGPRVRDALIWALLNDPSEAVRLEAVDALTRPQFVEDLGPVLWKTAVDDSSTAVRTRAVRAIRRLQDPRF